MGQRHWGWWLGLAIGCLGVLGLWGCGLGSASLERTFVNERYGFTLVYPADWEVQPLPSSRDGVVIVEPGSGGAVEIRSWATISLVPIPADPLAACPEVSGSNWVTAQGFPAWVTVEIQLDFSRVMLQLQRDAVTYHWQAQAPSDRFAQYYALFEGLMRQLAIAAAPQSAG